MKSLASYQLSKYLNQDVIVDTRLINLYDLSTNRKLIGILSPIAKGIRGFDIKFHNPIFTGHLLKELRSLHIIDYLCYQVDHSPINYNVIMDGQKAIGVCAFDNDSDKTFDIFCSKRAKLPLNMKGRPIIDKKGRLIYSHIDKELGEKLLNIDLHDLYNAMSPYLSSLQFYALKKRLLNLQKAIEKSKKEEKFLLSVDSKVWDIELEKEISGEYGNTYMYLLSHIRR